MCFNTKLFKIGIYISKYLFFKIYCQRIISSFVLHVFSIRKTNNDDEVRDVPLSEKLYGTLPASLMETKLVVKAVCEDPEVQAARAEVVKSKSVNELSQVTSFADIPIPDAIENLMKKRPERNTLAPAERKKKFKDQ